MTKTIVPYFTSGIVWKQRLFPDPVLVITTISTLWKTLNIIFTCHLYKQKLNLSYIFQQKFSILCGGVSMLPTSRQIYRVIILFSCTISLLPKLPGINSSSTGNISACLKSYSSILSKLIPLCSCRYFKTNLVVSDSAVLLFPTLSEISLSWLFL